MLQTDIFEMLGYRCSLYNGTYRWSSDIPCPEIVALVEALPVDEADFMATDLETDSAILVLATNISPAIFTSIKAHQCNRIRELRAAAYRNEADNLFFSHEADADSVDVWLAKRAQIKDRYPWPGSYR